MMMQMSNSKSHLSVRNGILEDELVVAAQRPQLLPEIFVHASAKNMSVCRGDDMACGEKANAEQANSIH